MNQRLLLGSGMLCAGLLVWNTATLRRLDARLAALESAQESADADASAAVDAAGREAAGAATRPTTRMAVPPRAGAGSAATPTPPTDVDPATLLGLDDPASREAFEDYLDGFLEAREEDRSDDDESEYLDHVTAAVELYCEESNLSEDVQEQIVLRLETAHEDWVAVDAAVEAGEIDRRERLERHGRIEEAVKSEMTELIGEEAWQELSDRLW